MHPRLDKRREARLTVKQLARLFTEQSEQLRLHVPILSSRELSRKYCGFSRGAKRKVHKQFTARSLHTMFADPLCSLNGARLNKSSSKTDIRTCPLLLAQRPHGDPLLSRARLLAWRLCLVPAGRLERDKAEAKAADRLLRLLHFQLEAPVHCYC